MRKEIYFHVLQKIAMVLKLTTPDNNFYRECRIYQILLLLAKMRPGNNSFFHSASLMYVYQDFAIFLAHGNNVKSTVVAKINPLMVIFIVQLNKCKTVAVVALIHFF